MKRASTEKLPTVPRHRGRAVEYSECLISGKFTTE